MDRQFQQAAVLAEDNCAFSLLSTSPTNMQKQTDNMANCSAQRWCGVAT